MLNLEYCELKREYEETKAEEKLGLPSNPEEMKTQPGELELQLIILRNRLIDIQKLYLSIDARSIDGSPIIADDINLLDLPKDILQEKAPKNEDKTEDEIDGAELLPDEMKYLEGHEGEVFITVELP